MKSYGVVLRKLRELNKLTMKQAAFKIEKSVGWLSQIENGIGAARITADEFERIVTCYDGQQFRKQFGLWIAKTKPADSEEIRLSGAILKYLREKAGLTLTDVSKEVELSKCYLSYIENGIKTLSPGLRDKLMHLYGYSPTSFKNFSTEDKRAKNIPVRYKLQALLKQIDETKL